MTIKFKLDPHQTIDDAVAEARLHLEALQDLSRPHSPPLLKTWNTIKVVAGELHLSPRRPRQPGEWR